MEAASAALAVMLVVTACGGSTKRSGEDAVEGPSTTGVTGVGGGAVTGSITAGSTTTSSTSGTGAAPQASCDDPTQPCGGSVLGSWSVVSSCLEVSGMTDLGGVGLGCTEVPVTGSLEVSGTLTFDEEGVLRDDMTTRGEVKIEMRTQCFDVPVHASPCTTVETPLTSTFGFASITCVEGEDGGCTCDANVEQAGAPTFLPEGSAFSASYAMNNDVLTVSYSSDVEYGYCAEGDLLRLTPQTAGPIGTLTGEIVMSR